MGLLDDLWRWLIEVITATFKRKTFSHTIAVNSDPTKNGGTTSPVPGTYTKNVGETLEVQAVPNSGWEFVDWTLEDGTKSTENPLKLTQ
jgi:hypothetical protein